MAYKKDPITNQIIELDFFGSEFDNWLEVSDQDLLQEAKDKKLIELLEARKVFQYKNITLNGVTYIATQTACTNLDGAISVLTDNNLTECNWLDANGNASILTLALAKQLRTAMFMQQSSAYMQESAFRATIADCATVEEVNAISIEL